MFSNTHPHTHSFIALHLKLYHMQIREKPVDESACRAYLHSYETAPARTCSAIVVTNTKTRERHSGVDFASQAFAHIPDDVVASVIAQGMF